MISFLGCPDCLMMSSSGTPASEASVIPEALLSMFQTFSGIPAARAISRHAGLACLRRPNDQGVPKPDHLHGHAAPIFVADDDVACLRDVARLQLAPLP